MSYEFLQHYWCFIVSLLGALLVFLLFVQGANSVARSLGYTEEGRRLVYNSTGRKWEFTFTTLVTFGGAFFASYPLFYSTSFGGAYWLWMIILFTFVLQAVSYEFQNKIGNLLGPRTFQFFLTLNGILGPLLLGGAVATFFEGSNFIVEKDNLIDPTAVTPIISRWANASHGLDALLNPWVLIFGFAVVFLARTLGILYVINNINDEDIRARGRVRLVGSAVPFVIFFVAYLVHLLLKDGYAYNDEGFIYMEPYKYLNNFLDMWYLLVILLIGVVLVLWGIATAGSVALLSVEPHGLLPLYGRPPVVADDGQLVLQRVHPPHDVLRLSARSLRAGLHRLLLARYRLQETRQGGDQDRPRLLIRQSDHKKRKPPSGQSGGGSLFLLPYFRTIFLPFLIYTPFGSRVLVSTLRPLRS